LHNQIPEKGNQKAKVSRNKGFLSFQIYKQTDTYENIFNINQYIEMPISFVYIPQQS